MKQTLSIVLLYPVFFYKSAVITKSKMSPPHKASGFTYFFKWWHNPPLKSLNDGAKPLIAKNIFLGGIKIDTTR